MSDTKDAVNTGTSGKSGRSQGADTQRTLSTVSRRQLIQGSIAGLGAMAVGGMALIPNQGTPYEIPVMRQQGGDAVINMASVSGHRGYPNGANYSSGKQL